MKKTQNCQILEQNREPREKSTAYVSLIILNGAPYVIKLYTVHLNHWQKMTPFGVDLLPYVV